MRRLREMNQASGSGVTSDVPADVTDKGKCNTSENPHLPRLPEGSKDTINQLSQEGELE
jgi:hypothetical protein